MSRPGLGADPDPGDGPEHGPGESGEVQEQPGKIGFRKPGVEVEIPGTNAFESLMWGGISGLLVYLTAKYITPLTTPWRVGILTAGGTVFALAAYAGFTRGPADLFDIWWIMLALGIGAYLSALGVAIKAFVRARRQQSHDHLRAAETDAE